MNLRLQNAVLSLILLTATAFFTGCGLGSSEEVNLPDGLYAQITTNKGDIICRLEYEKVPLTVANFVALSEGKMENTYKPLGNPFFDGLTFHRVMSNFMIQGGDPLANGLGGPGYQFADEFHPELLHNVAGTLSMANYGPATNGSQFFITHKATPWLDNRHSVFGYVTSGLATVYKIAQDDTIKHIEILRIGDAAGAFDAPAVFREKGGVPAAGNP